MCDYTRSIDKMCQYCIQPIVCFLCISIFAEFTRNNHSMKLSSFTVRCSLVCLYTRKGVLGTASTPSTVLFCTFYHFYPIVHSNDCTLISCLQNSLLFWVQTADNLTDLYLCQHAAGGEGGTPRAHTCTKNMQQIFPHASTTALGSDSRACSSC